MPYPLTGRSTVHSIYMSSHPLGVECQACGHRALTFKDVDGCRGDMKEIRTMRFKCSACGSRDWRGWLFGADEAEAWLEGMTVSVVDGSRPSF